MVRALMFVDTTQPSGSEARPPHTPPAESSIVSSAPARTAPSEPRRWSTTARVGLDVQLFDFAHLEPGETHDVGTHVRRNPGSRERPRGDDPADRHLTRLGTGVEQRDACDTVNGSAGENLRLGAQRSDAPEREVRQLEIGDDERRTGRVPRPRSRPRPRRPRRPHRPGAPPSSSWPTPGPEARRCRGRRRPSRCRRDRRAARRARMPRGPSWTDRSVASPRCRDSRRGAGAPRSSSSRRRWTPRPRAARPRARSSCGPPRRISARASTTPSVAAPVRWSVRSTVAIQFGWAVLAASPPPITSTSVASAPARSAPSSPHSSGTTGSHAREPSPESSNDNRRSRNRWRSGG